MTVKIALERDSYNSYPSGSLELINGENDIHIKLSDSDREISVNKKDLMKALRILMEEDE